MKEPTLYLMVGLPASGKSTYAEEISSTTGAVIHSSDALREELYRDVNHQDNNTELFQELHRRIKNDLRAGRDAIYDACNISKKRRVSFLRELKNIDCLKECICVMTPYESCLSYNSNRERKVPEDIIKKMYMNWCPPHQSEGFDHITLHYNCEEAYSADRYDITNLFSGVNGIDLFDQENSHHSLTLGEHCKKAYSCLLDRDAMNINLLWAALLHDIGKVFAKTHINAKGIEDGECHYYQHHCCGSYDSMFYTKKLLSLKDSDRIYIANLIYYHMHPYTSWAQSNKAKNRDRLLIGEKMYEDIMKLNEADMAAH